VGMRVGFGTGNGIGVGCLVGYPQVGCLTETILSGDINNVGVDGAVSCLTSITVLLDISVDSKDTSVDTSLGKIDTVSLSSTFTCAKIVGKSNDVTKTHKQIIFLFAE
jgi:hypothetical protein